MSTTPVGPEVINAGVSDVDWHRSLMDAANRSDKLFGETQKNAQKPNNKEYMLDEKEMLTIQTQILPGIDVPKGTVPIVGMVAGYALLSVVCPPLSILFAILGGCIGSSIGKEAEDHLPTHVNMVSMNDVRHHASGKKEG